MAHRRLVPAPVITSLVALVALVALAAGSTPAVWSTGIVWLDALERGLLVALVAVAAARAPVVLGWVWCVAAAVAVAATGDLGPTLLAATGVVLAATAAAGASGAGRGPSGRVSLAAGVAMLALTAPGLPGSAAAAGSVTGVLPPSWWVVVPTAAGAVLAVGALRGLRPADSAAASGPARVRLAGLPRVLRWCGAAVVVVLGLAALGALLVRVGSGALLDGAEAARRGETDVASERLGAASATLQLASQVLTVPVLLVRPVPVLGPHLGAVAEASAVAHDAAGIGAALAAETDADALRPRAGRIDLAAVEALTAPFDRASADLDRLVAVAVTARDGAWLLPPVEDRMDALLVELQTAAAEARTAGRVASVAPVLLGRDGPRHHLVLFTSPAESRELGGFVASFAVLTATDGRVTMSQPERSSDTSALTGDTGRRLADPDSYPQRFVQYEPEQHWQDVSGSPDFPTVARAAVELYAQSHPESPPIDGVLAVDPATVAALLQLTGPIFVPEVGATVSADEVRDVLLRGQYEQFPAKGDRVDFLSSVAEATFDRLTTGDLPGPARLAAVLGPPAQQRRLLFAPSDATTAELLRGVGVDGSFPPSLPPGPAPRSSPRAGPDVASPHLLAVVQANAGPSKLDAHLTRAVAYDPVVDVATGQVSAELSIALTNSAPAGLADYVLGAPIPGHPPGADRLLLSVYTPLDVTDLRVDGVPVPAERLGELGTWRWSVFVVVDPGTTVTVRAALAGTVAPPLAREVVVVRQPLPEPDSIRVGDVEVDPSLGEATVALAD